MPRKIMVLTLAALTVLSFGLIAPANGQNPGSKTAGSLQRTMGEEIIRTIEAHGLTVDEYNTILAEVQKTYTDTARRYHDMTRTE